MNIKLPIKIAPLKKNGKAGLLAGLILLGIASSTLVVKANNRLPVISTDFPNFKISTDRFPFPTIFSLPKEEREKTMVKPSETRIFLFASVLNSTMFALPAVVSDVVFVPDEKKNTEKNAELLSNGVGMLKSELESNVHPRALTELNKYKKYIVYREIVSRKPLLFADENSFLTAVSQKFFADFYAINIDNKKYNRAALSIEELEDDLISMGIIDSSSTYKKDLDEEISLEDYLNNIYFKLIPTSLWPVDVERSIENESIPTLSQSILNTPAKDINGFGIGMVFNIQEVIQKIVYYHYDSTTKTYSDYFTREPFSLEKVDIILDREIKLDETFLIKNGLNNDTNYNDLILWPNRTAVFDVEFSYDYFTNFKFSEFILLVSKYNENATIGEMLEHYRRLPIEYTIDYSEADFSKHPDL